MMAATLSLFMVIVLCTVLTKNETFAFKVSHKTPSMLRFHSRWTSLSDIRGMIVDAVLKSPLRFPIVQAARNTMIGSMKELGFSWETYYQRVYNAQDWTEAVQTVIDNNSNVVTPAYYRAPFHAYDDGNLCIQAALEQELAGKAVGVRNFPTYKLQAEAHLRDVYDENVKKLGGLEDLPVSPTNPQSLVAVDLGCGTGTSTRRLAQFLPDTFSKIIGIDLSPHMIAAGQFFQTAVPTQQIQWVDDFAADPRIELRLADAAKLPFIPDASVSYVNVAYVFHELPYQAARHILQEAQRILLPGGTLAIMEMDPTAPGYRSARANPALFAVFKSTEPYLNEYFDRTSPQLGALLMEHGFHKVQIVAATGRHLCCVARKKEGLENENENGEERIVGVRDLRPSAEERLAMDEHLLPMQKPSDAKVRRG